MVLVFGVDVPLIEVLLVMGIIMFMLLIESIVVIALLVSHLTKIKKLSVLKVILKLDSKNF